MPFCICSRDSVAILLYAPRILNEKTGCRSSRLIITVLPSLALSIRACCSGVSMAKSYTRAFRILPR